MAEEKVKTEKKITKVNSDGTKKTPSTKEERKEGAKGKRIAAILFWLGAIVCEVFAIMVISGYMFTQKDVLTMAIIWLVADLALVIVGSQFWKKANDIDPASKANKVKFFLWNQMGLIVSVLAFFPFIAILLKDKDMDPKTKKVLTIVAAAALALCSIFSIDFNPASEEDLIAAEQAIGDGDVYWTKYGKSYHIDPDCSSLTRSKELFAGSIDDAFAANRNDPCDFCVPQE